MVGPKLQGERAEAGGARLRFGRIALELAPAFDTPREVLGPLACCRRLRRRVPSRAGGGLGQLLGRRVLSKALRQEPPGARHQLVGGGPARRRRDAEGGRQGAEGRGQMVRVDGGGRGVRRAGQAGERGSREALTRR